MKKLTSIIMLVAILSMSVVAFAHSGGTDANGGHYDHSNGTYHKHNNGRR